MPTRFVDLPAYLTSLLESPSISANGLRQLHRSLEETWERVSVDSFLAGHPYWSICTGKTACQLFLYRPWQLCRGREQDLEQIHLILEHLQSEFVPADGPQITPHSAERLLRLLDKDFNFSQKVLAPEPMLVFLPDCGTALMTPFASPIFSTTTRSPVIFFCRASCGTSIPRRRVCFSTSWAMSSMSV